MFPALPPCVSRSSLLLTESIGPLVDERMMIPPFPPLPPTAPLPPLPACANPLPPAPAALEVGLSEQQPAGCTQVYTVDPDPPYASRSPSIMMPLAALNLMVPPA